MWMLVMFDLPVVEKEDRKAATDFRNKLLDYGFEMAQFSVYMRFFSSSKKVEVIAKHIKNSLPEGGKVSILQFTDKQYENIINYHGRSILATKKSPDQFTLF